MSFCGYIVKIFTGLKYLIRTPESINEPKACFFFLNLHDDIFYLLSFKIVRRRALELNGWYPLYKGHDLWKLCYMLLFPSSGAGCCWSLHCILPFLTRILRKSGVFKRELVYNSPSRPKISKKIGVNIFIMEV